MIDAFQWFKLGQERAKVLLTKTLPCFTMEHTVNIERLVEEAKDLLHKGPSSEVIDSCCVFSSCMGKLRLKKYALPRYFI